MWTEYLHVAWWKAYSDIFKIWQSLWEIVLMKDQLCQAQLRRCLWVPQLQVASYVAVCSVGLSMPLPGFGVPETSINMFKECALSCKAQSRYSKKKQECNKSFRNHAFTLLWKHLQLWASLPLHCVDCWDYQFSALDELISMKDTDIYETQEHNSKLEEKQNKVYMHSFLASLKKSRKSGTRKEPHVIV